MSVVDPAVNRPNDHYYEDLLGAAAFGTLDAAEAAQLEAWLATSASGRAHLAELRMIAGALGQLADDATPPAALRSRIEQAVMADVAWANPERSNRRRPSNGDASGASGSGIVPLATTPASGSKRPIPLWRPYLWAAAAALVLAVVAGIVLDRLVLDDDAVDGREAIAYELNLATPVPGLSAQLTYDAADQLFILQTENMPPAPHDHVYQVWMIDESGPHPMGVMNQSKYAVPAARDAYDAFAITVEPAPLGSAGPTTEPFFVAQLTDDAADR